MTTAFNLRKLLHRKSWEMCTPCPTATTAGAFAVSDKYDVIPNSLAFIATSLSIIYRYDGDEDSWLALPASGAAGTFAAGACGEMRGMGAMGGVFNQTATGGSTTTIVTNRTIVRSLAGRRIRVIAGAGMGYDSTITSNTIDANSVITVPAHDVAFDNTTVFQVFSGSFWLKPSGAGGISVYDLATNTWTARSATGLPSWATDGQLVSTISSAGSFATGTATAGAASTLTNSGKSWSTNQWTNYQIRITDGTGKGQIRTISSNTGTVITVSSAWDLTPDATSVYSIEGNDDFMYLTGNAAVTMYRFQVSTNTWTTLSPTAARGGAPGAGASLNWVDSVPDWTLGSGEAPLSFGSGLVKQNGRYIYSFRGNTTNILDAYDIAANTWISNIPYGNQFETFSTGTSSFDYGGFIYIQKEGTGRIYRFNISQNTMQAYSTNPHPQSTTVVGQKMFMLPYQDGGTEINFLYTMLHTRAELLRMMVI